MSYLEFLLYAIIYLFILSGLDQQITGVLAKGLKPEGKFHSYVGWQTLLNQSFAVYTGITETNLLIATLKYTTITWCWIGGGLDFLYFMMQGEIPDPEKILHWMPFKPKTWHWGIYTLGWLIAIIASWTTVITLF